ncbi:MAG: ABC transporter permease [Pirellulales bacterium]|nr:ABC transporter permease [Pirellulales bacterium]
MSTLDRKLLREFRATWIRLMAIISIIAVGVAVYVELSSVYNNISLTKDEYYAQCKMADFSVELKKAPLTEIDQVIEDFPQVTEFRSRIHFFATVDLDGVSDLLNGEVLSLPDEDSAVVNDIVLERGSYFTGQRDNEVIIHDAFARYHNLRPGTWIHLILNNRRQELFVVGTALSSEFVYLLGPGAVTPDPKHFGVFYLKRSFAEDVYDFRGAANQVIGRLSPPVRDRPDALLQLLDNRLSTYGVYGTTPARDQLSNRFLTEEIEGIATFSNILPFIFLSVAALVLNIMMTRWTEQQRTIVGVLKALGYSDLQVGWHFLKLGLMIGFVGGVVGAVLGFVLAEFVTSIYAQFYEFPELTNRPYPSAMLVGMGISLACALAGAAYGARKVLKLRPAEAMRPKPPAAGGAILLERFTKLWKQFGFSSRLVLRSVFRNRFRTLAGLFAAMMGTCILITGFMMQASIVMLIDFQFRLVQRSDRDLVFKDEQPIDALYEIRHLPGVDWAEPVLDVSCTFRNGPYSHRSGIQGIVTSSVLTLPRDEAGNRLRVPTSGLLMSRRLAEILHVKPGGYVEIEPTRGDRRVRKTQVVAVADGYLGLSTYADFEFLNSFIGEENTLTGATLSVSRSPREVRELDRELKRLPGVQSTTARQDSIDNLTETVIETQSILIYLLIGFAGVIFFGSVLNSSLINLAERAPEAATFRVLGYGPWEVGMLYLRESMVVNLVGTVLGIPLGYLLSVAMTEAYGTDLFRIPVVITNAIVIKTLLLSVFFALAAHMFVQRSIHKMDWLAALKVKE